LNWDVKMAFQELLPSEVTPLKSKVAEELIDDPTVVLRKVNGEPAGETALQSGIRSHNEHSEKDW